MRQIKEQIVEQMSSQAYVRVYDQVGMQVRVQTPGAQVYDRVAVMIKYKVENSTLHMLENREDRKTLKQQQEDLK